MSEISKEKNRLSNIKTWSSKVKITRKIKRINKITNEIKIYDSTREAERDGFDRRHIRMCCKSTTKSGGKYSYKGFYWEYLDFKHED